MVDMNNITENDALFVQALDQHMAGDWAAAEVAYRQILRAQPTHIEARHYLGVLLHQSGQSDAGLRLIQSAIEDAPVDAGRFNDLGNILSSLGRLEEAATAFQRALALDAGNAMFWNNLGYVLMQNNALQDAEAAFRQALQCDAAFAPALNHLAKLLDAAGKEEESSWYACQAFIQPPHEGKPLHHLGIAYYRLGMLAEAADCYRQWLRVEPDNPIARHHLSACEGAQIPVQAAQAYVVQHFDNLADQFDQKLVDALHYRGPEIIAALLQRYFPGQSFNKVVDAGCGTGLCVDVLRARARQLIGVDLSAKMLAKAAEKGQYDALHVADIQTFLASNQEVDLVVMADTLIYFGELQSLFATVEQSLAKDGGFVFTVEKSEANKPYALNPSGRYQHAPEYLLQVIAASGLKLLGMEEIILRNEFHEPIKGLVVAVSKARE
jgi:predicted TPR repeat methyltransferase